MAKICTCGCNGSVFSKGLCMKAWRREYGKPLKQTAIKPSGKPIRPHTDKQLSLNKQLSQVKKKIELEAVQNNEYYCKGCGKSYVGLDKSHLLPIGKYKHLELEEENMQLLCREPCHRRWESNNYYEMVKLDCFEENMLYVRLHDESLYNRIMNQKLKFDET